MRPFNCCQVTTVYRNICKWWVYLCLKPLAFWLQWMTWTFQLPYPRSWRVRWLSKVLQSQVRGAKETGCCYEHWPAGHHSQLETFFRWKLPMLHQKNTFVNWSTSMLKSASFLRQVCDMNAAIIRHLRKMLGVTITYTEYWMYMNGMNSVWINNMH